TNIANNGNDGNQSDNETNEGIQSSDHVSTPIKNGSASTASPLSISNGHFNPHHLPELNEEILKKAFEEFGEVASISLPRSISNKSLKGFAFVHYPDNESGELSAAAAISLM